MCMWRIDVCNMFVIFVFCDCVKSAVYIPWIECHFPWIYFRDEDNYVNSHESNIDLFFIPYSEGDQINS